MKRAMAMSMKEEEDRKAREVHSDPEPIRDDP